MNAKNQKFREPLSNMSRETAPNKSNAFLMSPPQLAQFLDVPLQTIYDWSSRGVLDFCKRRLGRHVRFVSKMVIERLEKGDLYERQY